MLSLIGLGIFLRNAISRLVLVLICGAAVAGCSTSNSKASDRPVVPVLSALAERRRIPVELHAIGNVEPYSSVAVRAEVTGELTAVFFREGQDVKKGDLLFVLDRRALQAELKKQEGNLAKDRAQAALARTQLARYEALILEGVVAREQYDQVRANADALDAAVQADEGAVESARVQLAYGSVRSPIGGRTGSLLVHAGNIVRANDTVIVTVNQIEPIVVTFALPEQDFAETKRRAGAGSLEVTATIGDDKNRSLERGILSFIDNTIDTSTGTVRLKGRFENKNRRLWPGQFVDVTLTLDAQTEGIVIPSQAVTTGQQNQFVFVVRSDMTVEVRTVRLGRTVGGETVVEDGISPGERVVTDGQLRLVGGAKVQLRDAPSARDRAGQESEIGRGS